MRQAVVVSVAAVVVAVWGSTEWAENQKMQASKVTGSPQWETIKSLVGEWEGYTEEGGKKLPSRIEVRMTGDGSAVMHVLDRGTPHEMVTMFHMDKQELMATHYCAAHNQPRFRAVPSTNPGQVVFEFMDGTNIRPGDGHMSRIVITVIDPDHHDEEWGFQQNGAMHTGVFHMTRVKTGAANP